MASEEAIMLSMENSTENISAFSKIPYSLISREYDGDSATVTNEFNQICKYYKIYKEGTKFQCEGTNGDYIPASLRFKLVASLINKEARFLFAESPDIKVEAKGDVGKISEANKNELTTINDLLKTIFDENRFEDSLLKAAKDCFIGKRVAGLVNFNETDGVTITFLPATQFIYETKINNPNILKKFVCFVVVKDSIRSTEKRIFRKKYELEEINGETKIFLEETLFDGNGIEIETLFDRQEIMLDFIPAVIFINDGLTGEEKGESEVELLKDYESWYSRLASADIDAERKGMNPTKFVVDMDSDSTKGLKTSAGALWDLGSDQNLDNAKTQVGLLEPSMNYSQALKTSLDRIKTSGYEQIDMPNITLESLQGAITSGKSLKAIYWPLIVRCKEKMKMWAPQLRKMVDIIIAGAIAYPNCVERYVNNNISPVAYEVLIMQNTPLPEDEVEEKQIDLSEVEAKTMSLKSYMQKWRGLTDDEVEAELKQIAYERQILEDSFMPMSEETSFNVDEE